MVRLVWLQAEDPNEDISIALIPWGQSFISELFNDILEYFLIFTM